MKIGIDVHGVITKNPELWADITMGLVFSGHEVHILTGVEEGEELVTELANHAITYTHLFSITTYHKSIGTHIVYKDEAKRHPQIAPPKWDRTKADYCEREGVTLHIDDSTEYGKYFVGQAQYLIYNEGIESLLKAIVK